jgi:predicted short-subunit dehydrogenase-like oxidoreductase (DUF2520 family)
MQIVLIGAGRLATQLGLALRSAGHEVTAVWSRTMESAEMLTAQVGGVPTNDVGQLPLKADVFVVSVKDAVLTTVVAQAVEGRGDQLFVHTAGSMPLSLFSGYATRYGVLYPMQSFSKERRVDFAKIPVFIEAVDADSLAVIRRLATSVSRRVSELSTADRKYLHLAAVFACNFANHCYALSAKVLEQHGLSFDVMLPLIDETAAKVHEMHPREAQTGPAVRYDENVINMQAAMLSDDPSLRDIYERLSLSIHELSND